MKALKSVFLAHYKQFVRDRAALFFTFIFPIMFILIFGWAFSDPGINTFNIGLVDQGSPKSFSYIVEALDHIILDEDRNVFDIQQGQLDEKLQLLQDGELDAVIVIPEEMDSALEQVQSVSLQLYYDPSQISHQQTMIPILNQVVEEIDRSIQGNVRIITLEEQSVQSHDLRYIDYLVPGILGMSLMFTGIFGGIPIIQQRQAHIIKRLGCTPLRRSMLIFGELAFRMILVILTAVLIIVVGRLVFDVQMVGNWASLCGIVILGTLVFSCLGYLIAAFVKTEEGAIPIINAITFPMMFLSGTFFEVSNMPSFIEPVVKIMPLTYLGDALRQIMVDGSPLYPMTTDILVMAGWTLVCLVITIRFFRWD
ncbi:MAG: ABC transporter permease [Chloroflexi bacterium]|nr:ABC transporter permease [Chloroflexota bacterium]